MAIDIYHMYDEHCNACCPQILSFINEYAMFLLGLFLKLKSERIMHYFYFLCWSSYDSASNHTMFTILCFLYEHMILFCKIYQTLSLFLKLFQIFNLSIFIWETIIY